MSILSWRSSGVSGIPIMEGYEGVAEAMLM
jgi:hypothetical protein